MDHEGSVAPPPSGRSPPPSGGPLDFDDPNVAVRAGDPTEDAAARVGGLSALSSQICVSLLFKYS